MINILEYSREVFRYRDLILSFAVKEINVKYKQTILGLMWAIIRPIVSVTMFTYLFKSIGKLPSDNVPYPIIVLSGILFWQPFSTTLQDASLSIISNSNLVTKVYFPRLILPLSTMIPPLLEAIITYTIMIVYLIMYNFEIHVNILIVPFILVYNQILAFIFSIFISAINVRYRDAKHLMPFLIQFGMFVTPVAYISNLVPKYFKFLINLNPIAFEIDLFRYILTGNKGIMTFNSFFFSSFFTFLVLVLSVRFFIKSEKEFSDYI